MTFEIRDIKDIEDLGINTIKLILNKMEYKQIKSYDLHSCIVKGCINNGLPFLCSSHQWALSQGVNQK